jgi:hypothetical protein
MRLLLVLGCLAIAAAAPAARPAAAFTPPGLWDPLPLDAPVRPPASVGARVSAAEARINATNRTRSDRPGARPGSNQVVEDCSLQIGSVTLPSNGLAGSPTIVTNADVRGTIIQVCR